jgi:3-hydroxybutyryl-CoA dehydratase
VSLRGRPYSSLSAGEEFWDAITVTETHVVLAAGLFNDPGPNHVNRLQAEQSRFGAQVAHGTLLNGIMMGILGNALGSTIVAMLELTTRWQAPTRLGDTLIGRWRVAEKTDKPTFGGGGIVAFDGEGLNQDGVVLLESRVVLAVGEEGPWDPATHIAARRGVSAGGGAQAGSES